MKKLLTGNEAIARGAYEAGVHFAAAYPGTPSTEILENIATYKGSIYAEWAPNEKVALEGVIGASIAGGRALASMKHVGVNVAADPMFTASYLGVNGGLVLITADEPGMHSSQNEQDNRNYARFAKMPMFEPSNSQESKDMIKDAFELSEEYDTPVLFRITTRICHSKGVVECQDRIEVPFKKYERNIPKTSPIPVYSRKMRLKVEDRMNRLKIWSDESSLNYEIDNGKKIGVIASGGSFVFSREVFGDDASYFKLGFTYPLPLKKLKEFCEKMDTVYVIEENDPLIENELKVLGLDVRGSDTFPFYGEKTPEVIRKSVFGEALPTMKVPEEKIIPRPPTLCAGCPHRGFFYELGKRKNTMISGDIGCYALAVMEPYNAIDMSLCMGASLSMGHGAQKVFNMKDDQNMRVVSVLGDSTFFHTGINSLMNVAYNRSNTINVILDNRITGMTGHQENPGSGYTVQGMPTKEADIKAMVEATGIEHIRQIDPNNLKEVKEALDWAYDLDEPSVIITRYPCVLKKFSSQDKEEFEGAFKNQCIVDEDKCIGCRKCIKTGCPTLVFDKGSKKVTIDKTQCVGCEVCVQVCPVDAIAKEAN
jgi:indolepyruvate ferredoxin oxidoreductase alpha subunit